MYTPINNHLAGSLTPFAAIDFSLHSFLGFSWFILLPYTLFGIALMAYSQTMLFHGQHQLKREESLEAASTQTTKNSKSKASKK